MYFDVPDWTAFQLTRSQEASACQKDLWGQSGHQKHTVNHPQTNQWCTKHGTAPTKLCHWSSKADCNPSCFSATDHVEDRHQASMEATPSVQKNLHRDFHRTWKLFGSQSILEKHAASYSLLDLQNHRIHRIHLVHRILAFLSFSWMLALFHDSEPFLRLPQVMNTNAVVNRLFGHKHNWHMCKGRQQKQKLYTSEALYFSVDTVGCNSSVGEI